MTLGMFKLQMCHWWFFSEIRKVHNLLVITHGRTIAEVLKLVELMTWHQLYTVHPNFLQNKESIEEIQKLPHKIILRINHW